MTTALARAESDALESDTLEKVYVDGNVEGLTAEQRLAYYAHLCASLGLNPLTRPFEYIRLNGKLTLYAKRDATDQLRRLHQVSITIVDRRQEGDLYVVCARATTPDGRQDESTGAVHSAGKRGEDLANALMKAETKAKRRATLSICGLGLNDETEVEELAEREPRRAKMPQVVEPPAPPAPIGVITAITEKAGGALITLDTGFTCSTRQVELLQASVRLRDDGRRVELVTRASSNPKKYAPILVELRPEPATS